MKATKPRMIGDGIVTDRYPICNPGSKDQARPISDRHRRFELSGVEMARKCGISILYLHHQCVRWQWRVATKGTWRGKEQ